MCDLSKHSPDEFMVSVFSLGAYLLELIYCNTMFLFVNNVTYRLKGVSQLRSTHDSSQLKKKYIAF